jgi:hypothetical protein
MHFGVSMHYTQVDFTVGRMKLFLRGIVWPGAMALPSLLLVPFWWYAQPKAAPGGVWIVWFAATAALAWFVSLPPEDRDLVRSGATRLLRRRIAT